MSSPTGRMKPTDPPFRLTPISHEYDYNRMLVETDFSEAEARVLALMSAGKLKAQVDRHFFAGMYGARPDELQTNTSIVAKESDPAFDLKTMMDMVEREMDRKLQNDIQIIKTLEAAGFQVHVNPLLKGTQMVAILPADFQAAIDEMAKKLKEALAEKKAAIIVNVGDQS